MLISSLVNKKSLISTHANDKIFLSEQLEQHTPIISPIDLKKFIASIIIDIPFNRTKILQNILYYVFHTICGNTPSSESITATQQTASERF